MCIFNNFLRIFTTVVTTKTEKLSPCVVKIEMEYTAEEIGSEFDAKYAELNNTVSIPGFRKGRAPRVLLEKKYGKTLKDDVKQEIIQKGYEQAVKDNNLDPVYMPDVDFTKIEFQENAPFKFSVEIEVKPDFEVKDYAGIALPKPKIEINKEEIDAGIAAVRENYAELIPVDRPSQMNDLLVVDQKIICEDKPVMNEPNSEIWINEKLALFGERETRLDDGLKNKRPGGVFTMDMKIPDKFPKKEFAGKSALLTIAIKEIKEKKLPEITEQWAKDNGFESLDTLRAEITKRVSVNKENEARRENVRKIEEILLAKVNFELPEKLFEAETQNYIYKAEIDMRSQGFPEEAIKEQLGKLESSSKEKVTRNMKLHFVLDYIADKEKIFVTENDVNTRIDVMARYYNQSVNEVKEYFEKQGMMKSLRNQIKEEKVMGFLMEKAVLTEEPAKKSGK